MLGIPSILVGINLDALSAPNSTSLRTVKINPRLILPLAATSRPANYRGLKVNDKIIPETLRNCRLPLHPGRNDISIQLLMAHHCQQNRTTSPEVPSNTRDVTNTRTTIQHILQLFQTSQLGNLLEKLRKGIAKLQESTTRTARINAIVETTIQIISSETF